jgi:hypothetical protein
VCLYNQQEGRYTHCLPARVGGAIKQKAGLLLDTIELAQTQLRLAAPDPGAPSPLLAPTKASGGGSTDPLYGQFAHGRADAGSQAFEEAVHDMACPVGGGRQEGLWMAPFCQLDTYLGLLRKTVAAVGEEAELLETQLEHDLLCLAQLVANQRVRRPSRRASRSSGV